MACVSCYRGPGATTRQAQPARNNRRKGRTNRIVMPRQYGFEAGNVPEKSHSKVIGAPDLDGLLDLLRIPLTVERLLCQSGQFCVGAKAQRDQLAFAQFTY